MKNDGNMDDSVNDEEEGLYLTEWGSPFFVPYEILVLIERATERLGVSAEEYIFSLVKKDAEEGKYT